MARQSQRRRQALSRERIIEVAVEVLDAEGADALTVRVLTDRLSTGSGAIYHHIGSMSELLQAATDTVVADALAPRHAPDGTVADGTVADGTAPGRGPADTIRDFALGLFDATAAHPWLATQLIVQINRNPWGPLTTRTFESIGRQIRALDVPQRDWFATTSTLVHYVLGALSQNARMPDDHSAAPTEAERAEFLATTSQAWQDLDPDDYPFLHAVIDQMSEHDDREQFLTGIELILAGIQGVDLL